MWHFIDGTPTQEIITAITAIAMENQNAITKTKHQI
jgi:hypothetical protein